jgi:hypothetical protein
MIAYFGFSFDGLYGQDAYEYLRYTERLKSFLLTGKPPGDYLWGVYYPIFGSLVSLIIPNAALALQLLSVVSLVIATIYTNKIIRLVYPEKASGSLPFLFFTLSPIVLIHSLLAMSDMMGCCLTIAAVYFLLSFTKKVKTAQLLAGVTLSAFAIFTRYAAVVVLIPFAVTALVALIRNKKYTLMLYSAVLLSLITIPHLWIRSQNSLQFLSHQWLQSWQVTNLFQADFMTVDGLASNHFINLVYVFFSFFHPIFMVFGGLLFLVILWKRNFYISSSQKLILVSILMYAVFLGGIPFQNKRFLLLSFPLVIIFLFPFIQRFIAPLKNKKAILGLIALIQISLAAYFIKPFYDRNSLEKSIATQIKPYQNQTLYAFDIDIALHGRKLQFNYKNLFLEKYDDFEKNALVLVNEKQILRQWRGKNPAINLSGLRKKYDLKLIKKFSKDWRLYKIQTRGAAELYGAQRNKSKTN